MARRKNQRIIRHIPQAKGFAPISDNTPLPEETIEMHYEEYEVIHLLDYEGLSQEEASQFLQVSRPTLTRIYLSARKKIAIALSENKSIVFSLPQNNIVIKEYFCRSCQTIITADNTDKNLSECPQCHSHDIVLLEFSRPRQHMGMGRNGRCICPQCNTSYPHTSGKPCRSQICPQCNTPLIREGSAQHQLILNRKK
jgi:predicted DNA-binding protein (UPF0251 family)/uncharacterized protein YbaR (Trm112 family)